MSSKPIVGFENYLIYEDGRIYNTKYNKFLKYTLKKEKFTCEKGYYVVGLTHNKKRYSKRLHRLLAETFIPNPNNLPCVDHIDRNTHNNDINNLRWVSYRDNIRNMGVMKNNKLGEKFISQHKFTKLYIFSIRHNNKRIIEKGFKTLEDAIEFRNDYIKENPQYKI